MNPSQIMTILTLVTFILGLGATHLGSGAAWLAAALVTTLISYLFPPFNHMRRSQLFKCLITTYIFGIVDGYYIHRYHASGDFDIFGIFAIMSTIRYYGEFQLVNCFHHCQLQWNSYLIYHSKMYLYTNIFLLLQHIITKYLLDLSYKQYHPLMFVSTIVATLCLIMRILAFFTAKSNFTHQVSYSKKTSHILVTHGIYSIFRHPSYTGFFWYTVATMLMIGNFASAILFAIMLSIFFERRISVEQTYLLYFFGQSYQKYRQKTYVLIPYLQKIVQKYAPIDQLVNKLR